MSERLKYPINGLFHFSNLQPEENHVQYLEEDIWIIPDRLILTLVVFREQTVLSGILRFQSFKPFRGSCCISFQNKSNAEKLEFKMKLHSPEATKHRVLKWEKEFLMSESVLEMWNEDNGWMENGELTIDYGIQIESIKDDFWTFGHFDIWKFNFVSELFDSENKGNMITIINDEGTPDSPVFRCHKQLLEFHSPLFHTPSPGNHTIKFTGPVNPNHLVWSSPRFVRDDIVVQCAHGVQVKFYDEYSIHDYVHVAQFYQLPNVINYLEREIIKEVERGKSHWLHDDNGCFGYWIHHSSELNLRRLLAHCLKQAKFPEVFHLGIDRADLNKMSGEVMKQIVKYLFSQK